MLIYSTNIYMDAHSSPWAVLVVGYRMVNKTCMIPIHFIKKQQKERKKKQKERKSRKKMGTGRF